MLKGFPFGPESTQFYRACNCLCDTFSRVKCFFNTRKVWLIQVRFSMLYLVLQVYLILNSGEITYIKKNPRKPLHLTQTQSLLPLHHDLSISVAYCFHKLEIPEFSISYFLWLASEKLTYYHLSFKTAKFLFSKLFDLFLRVKHAHIPRFRNSQQPDFITHIPETHRSHTNMLSVSIHRHSLKVQTSLEPNTHTCANVQLTANYFRS